MRNAVEQSNDLDTKQGFESLKEKIEIALNRKQDLVDLVTGNYRTPTNNSNDEIDSKTQKPLNKITTRQAKSSVESKTEEKAPTIITTGDQNQIIKNLYKRKEYKRLVEYFESNFLKEQEKKSESFKEELKSQASFVFEALKRIVGFFFYYLFY